MSSSPTTFYASRTRYHRPPRIQKSSVLKNLKAEILKEQKPKYRELKSSRESLEKSIIMLKAKLQFQKKIVIDSKKQIINLQSSGGSQDQINSVYHIMRKAMDRIETLQTTYTKARENLESIERGPTPDGVSSLGLT